jgi:hypothetical protein
VTIGRHTKPTLSVIWGFKQYFMGAPQVLHRTGLNGTEIVGFGGNGEGDFVAVSEG